VKRNPIFLSTVITFAAVASLSGCSWFHPKSDAYSTAVESRPLEVPPDLDSPANANELLVPPPGSATASGVAAANAAPAPAPAQPTLAANQLLVSDNAADTWTKVGPAIESAKIGVLSSRDENQRSFILDFNAPIPKPSAESHWYTAVFNHLGFGEGDPVKAHLLVRVVDDGDASKVVVAGNGSDKSAAAASLRVIQILHDKLPGSSFPPASTPAPAAAPVASAPSPATTYAVPPAPAASTAPASAPPAMASAPPPAASATPPPITGASAGSTDLHVADTVPNTWTRVGLALERAQLGALSGRDENAHTYILDFSATLQTNAEGEHHWYTRVLHPFGGGDETKTKQVTRRLTVRVAADAGGARVDVQGDGTDKETMDAARHVAQVLRERLT
jgi:uncharacterized lipoprotein